VIWRAALAGVVAAGLLVGTALAVETRFWDLEGPGDFLAGEIEGLSLRADGELILAPDLTWLDLEPEDEPPRPFLWAAVRDRHGNLYVGSGIPGLVHRVDPSGEASRFFTAPELQVQALAIDSEDRLLVAASPPGRVYRLTPEGEPVLLFDSEERYIWDLAVDPEDAVYVATGEQGILFRVEPDGEVTEVFDSDEPHLVSLALEGARSVIAGSSGSGLVYRFGRDGAAEVLLDTDGTEVAALAVATDGSILAGVDELAPAPEKETDDRREKEPEERLAGELPEGPAPAPGGVEDLELDDEELALRAQRPEEPLRLRSTLYRIDPSGRSRALWRSGDEGIQALAIGTGGRVYFGTGVPGRLYGMTLADPRPRLLARFPDSQVTALATGPDDLLFALTSNQGRLFRAADEFGSSGTFLSAVRDAGGRAEWGRVSWEASTPAGSRVEVATRSGNAARPDATWSEWSPAYPREGGSDLASPPARYLQVRARLGRLDDATSPRLRAISVSYREENLAPVVSPPRLEKRDGEAPPGRRREVRWDAEDPNGDPLAHDLDYRREEEETWVSLARALEAPEYEWNTGSLPGGRYRLRVRASDAPGNGPDRALVAEAMSGPLILDHEPPAIEVLSRSGKGGVATLSLRVTDEVSPVVRLQVAVDGGSPRWLQPVDGLADSRDERYEVALPDLGPKGHVLRFEARDREGNRRSLDLSMEVEP
jgi:hypothetical protein